jgi:hypothetical protein
METILDHYYDNKVCTAETIEEMQELLKNKVAQTTTKIIDPQNKPIN